MWQRIPVAVSCIIFAGLLSPTQLENHSHILFTALAALACIEKVAATANTVAVERDWVSHVLGSPHILDTKNKFELTGCHRIRGR